MDNNSKATKSPVKMRGTCKHKRQEIDGSIMPTFKLVDMKDGMLIMKCTRCGAVTKRKAFTPEETEKALANLRKLTADNDLDMLNISPQAATSLHRINADVLDTYSEMIETARQLFYKTKGIKRVSI